MVNIGSFLNILVVGRNSGVTSFTSAASSSTPDGNGKPYSKSPGYKKFRAGEAFHSKTDVSKIENKLGYALEYEIKESIAEAMPWYIKNGSEPIMKLLSPAGAGFISSAVIRHIIQKTQEEMVNFGKSICAAHLSAFRFDLGFIVRRRVPG